jgi:ParB-like nuclease domain
LKDDIAKVIETSKIQASKYNLRRYDDVEPEDSKDFQQLCFNIQENGLIEPIIVRKVGDRYEAVSGSRRLRALKKIQVTRTTAIVKDLSDNDVRVISLAENIVRKGMNDDSKVLSLEEIYKSANKRWDRETVIKYLSLIRNRAYRARRSGQTSDIDYLRSISEAREDKKYTGLVKDNIPPEFYKLFLRIGYSASTQYNILKGYGPYEDEDTDWTRELDESIRPELERPVFKDKPIIKNETARRASKKRNPREAKQIIRQAMWDVQTGAIQEDEEGVSYDPSKRQDLFAKTEENPVRAREKIIDYAEKMYKLLTGVEMNSNINTAETQAVSEQSVHNMKEVCSYRLGLRELPALEGAVAPLQKALDKFVDVMYDVGDAERKKNELQKR